MQAIPQIQSRDVMSEISLVGTPKMTGKRKEREEKSKTPLKQTEVIDVDELESPAPKKRGVFAKVFGSTPKSSRT